MPWEVHQGFGAGACVCVLVNVCMPRVPCTILEAPTCIVTALDPEQQGIRQPGTHLTLPLTDALPCQVSLSFAQENEDAVSIALTCVHFLLEKYSVDPRWVGR